MERKYQVEALASGTIFILLLGGFMAYGRIPFDESIQFVILSLRNPGATVVMKIITYSANWQFIIGVCLTLWLIKKWRIFPGIILSVSPLLASLLYKIIKEGVERPRPPLLLHLVTQGGFSFPSGHAMIGLIFYGLIGFILLEKTQKDSTQRMLSALIALYIFLIGTSRIYLGVHFPSDVLAGWSLGFLLLLLILKLPVGFPGQRKYSLYKWTKEYQNIR